MRLLRFSALALGCAALLHAAPAITSVYNAASYTPPGLPNSGIAQGSIFILFGSGLGPSTLQQVESYPLPTTQGLGGTSIQVTVGSATETCPMIYTSAGQVAAILPSATPVGTGTLALTFQGVTSSTSIQVLAANFGTLALNEAGSGPGVVTDTSFNPITYINPAHPGQTLILWGTGLGAITGSETEPPMQVDLHTGVQVFVAGQSATVLYGGRGSSPGLDQIDFTIPSGVSTGCKTSVAVLVKGVTGNITTLAIAPDGQATCGDTAGALTAANLEKAISSGSLNIGIVQLSRFGSGDNDLLAGYGSFPLNSLIRSYGGTFGPSIGSCVAYEVSGSSLVLRDPILPTYLDGGSDLAITGPAGTKTIAEISKGEFLATLAAAPSTFVEPGSYSVSNGNGGAGVGSFTWDLTLPSNVVPTNIPSSISRGKNLTLTWTGGSAYPVVTIFGYNGLIAGGSNSYVEFICNAVGSAEQFTIPSVILNLLPPDGFGAFGVPGVALEIAGYAEAHFTATGSPGLDVGTFGAFVANGKIAKIQ
ncbi:MAG: hypothetical protein ACLPWF_05755 [Bryobacteraceae bacterium]